MSATDRQLLERELQTVEPDGQVMYVHCDGFYAIVPAMTGQEGVYYRGGAALVYLGITYRMAQDELHKQFDVQTKG